MWCLEALHHVEKTDIRYIPGDDVGNGIIMLNDKSSSEPSTITFL